MTRRKAEVLTGYEIRPLPAASGSIAYGAYLGDQLVAEARRRSEREALTALINVVYQMHSRQVLDRHGWRCARCGGSYLLQIHHRKFRSHGGTHRLDNLEPVCGDCHRLIHGRERSGLLSVMDLG